MSTLFSPPTPSSADEHEAEWPLRAWGLGLLGGLSGLAIHFLLRPDAVLLAKGHAAEIRLTVATFICVSAAMFALLVERRRIAWSVVFALFSGCILALTTYWDSPFNWDADNPWQLVCGLLCVGIAAPLFQAWRNQKGEPPTAFSIPYARAYNHAWTNVVLWCSACLFVVVTWLMAILLGELFRLIGIRLLHDLLQKGWIIWPLIGAAMGTGIALLRDREPMLSLLQHVVTTVLAVLAPLLALGLIVFLTAIPATGLAPLWGATKSTTPILLGCIVGALCLANAVIGETDAQTARGRLLRASALVLAVTLLPLATIGAISVGSRIHQYGLTPARLWAVIFTAIACAYGLAYLVSIVRGRAAAAPHLRVANIRLAVGLCGLAFLLSTPLINFGAISAHDQMARIKNGTTPADRIDWQALRFDFGSSGIAATRELARYGATPAIRSAAANALRAKDRWALSSVDPIARPEPVIDLKRVTILPHRVAMPKDLHRQLTDYNACGAEGPCAIIYDAGSSEAVIVHARIVRKWRKDGEAWAVSPLSEPSTERDSPKAIDDAIIAGRVEIRTVPQRQIFVDGKPVGETFK